MGAGVMPQSSDRMSIPATEAEWAVSDALLRDRGGELSRPVLNERAMRDARLVIETLRNLPVEQRMEAMGMVPALSIPPVDCNDDCMDGPCTCSGTFRVRAWGEADDPIRPVAEGVRPHRG